MPSADRPDNGLESRRQNLRRNVLAARAALPPEEVSRRSALICQHLLAHFAQIQGLRLGFCWPVRNEPDIRPVLALWRAGGSPTCLPLVLSEASALAFRDWQPGERLEADRYGIPSCPEGPLVIPEVLLLPCNAVDAGAYRLGYGGGFFDRTLAKLQPRPLAIGLAFEDSRVDSIFPGEYDQPLDALVTEAGAWQRVDGRLRALALT